jgi:hypothetical protein
MRPSTAHGLTDRPLRLLSTGIGCGALAPPCLALAESEALQHTLLGTQTPAVATTTCLDYLHPHARTNDAPIHGLTDKPLCLLSTGIGCGVLAPRSRQDTATHTARDSNLGSGNHDMSRLPTPTYPNDAPIHGHGLTDKPLCLLSTDIGCSSNSDMENLAHFLGFANSQGVHERRKLLQPGFYGLQ